MSVFGDYLRAERKRLGLTLRQVGAIIGVSAPYICDIEQGFRPSLPPEKVDRLLRSGFDVVGLRLRSERNGYCPNCLCERCRLLREEQGR